MLGFFKVWSKRLILLILLSNSYPAYTRQLPWSWYLVSHFACFCKDIELGKASFAQHAKPILFKADFNWTFRHQQFIRYLQVHSFFLFPNNTIFFHFITFLPQKVKDVLSQFINCNQILITYTKVCWILINFLKCTWTLRPCLSAYSLSPLLIVCLRLTILKFKHCHLQQNISASVLSRPS